MTCIRVEHGFICGPDDFVDLAPFGSFVWMEWHSYHGPTFYRSKAAIKPISVPSKKTWDAFGLWQKSKTVAEDN